MLLPKTIKKKRKESIKIKGMKNLKLKK